MRQIVMSGMHANELVFLGLKSKVSAVSTRDGTILWATELPHGMGGGFVTLLSDGPRVYACAYGQLHCLESSSGVILWTNELKGYGYGIASLCVPGLPTSSDAAICAQIIAEQQAADSVAASSSAGA